MTSMSWRLAMVGLVLMAAACGETADTDTAAEADSGPIAQQEEPSVPTLEGGYRLSYINDLRPPTEWPAGSGTTLEMTTLELDPSGSYSIQRIIGGPLGSEPGGERGTYTTSADTLYLTPEGDAARVAYQYELAPNGELRLRDADENLWVYTPVPRPR